MQDSRLIDGVHTCDIGVFAVLFMATVLSAAVSAITLVHIIKWLAHHPLNDVQAQNITDI